VDVRLSITDVARANQGEARVLTAKLGWLGGEPDSLLTFGVVISALGSARPVEVVEALTDPTVAREAPLARLGLWGACQEDGGTFVDPLQVASPAVPLVGVSDDVGPTCGTLPVVQVIQR
jgi:hypothetical protein